MTHARVIPYHPPYQYFTKLATQPYAQLFESQATDHPSSRYSYIVWQPQQVWQPVTLNSLDTIQRYWQVHQQPPIANLPPFQGGLAGYIPYDVGNLLEPLRHLPHAPHHPVERGILAWYPHCLAFDHLHQQAWIISHDTAPDVPLPTLPDSFIPVIHSRGMHDRYRNQVATVVEAIHNGDCIQANIAQPFQATIPENYPCYALYCQLRQANPAPFAGYIHAGTHQVLSCSPERFIESDRESLRTDPIKGTIPRDANNTADALAAQSLAASEKDRAENLMIVDLLRNDLARSCMPGSINVPSLCRLESFASVHHLVSTVTGVLQPTITPFQAFLNAFPGGSISGAPKMQARHIIAVQEQQPRGAYCGSMLLWSASGAFDSNILIRTITIQQQCASFWGGCGITAYSQPDHEQAESLAKIQRLADVLADCRKSGSCLNISEY